VIDASIALASRLVLATVLSTSAGAKLRSRAEVRRQLDAIAGDRVAAAVSPWLPAIELGVAVALVAWWSPVPGIVALILLVVFTGALVRAHARNVPCACFGAGAGEAAPGVAAIVRNGVLAALAALAIGDPGGASVVATVGFVALFGVVAAGAVLLSRSRVSGA
jgi:Methylamine utilisation protein MauE